MRSKFQIFALALLSLFLVQCQKEASFTGGPDPVIETPLPITAHLQGNVFDENNAPASGVTVKVSSKTAITDSKGYFRIMSAALDKRSSVVTAEMNGYFKAYRTFSATSGTNHIEFKLTKRSLSGTIDGATGGEVSLSNGAKVQLPASSVVIASTGAAYTGTVNVYAAFIDPTDAEIGRTVPGSFMANNASNTRVILESYGMMAVELSTTSGEKLQIKTGSTSKLTMPIPTSLQGSAPASIPLWYVDEQTGIWQEEGTASKSGSLYVGEVKHYTYWNCDIPYSTVPISFTLQNAAGEPLVHAYVRIVRASAPNQGMVHGSTDSLGQAHPLVPANQALIMNVYDQCGTIIYSQNIGPFNQSTNVGVITLPNSVNASVTVTGTLHNCSGSPVTNGYAVLIYNNTARYGAVDANGNFSISFLKCSSSSITGSITGVDAAANVQGSPQPVVISQAVTNIGVYSACGTSSQQFINYTLDGVSYSIQGLATDSLTAYTQSQGTTVAHTYISGFTMTNNNELWFRFNSPNQVAGSYAITEMGVNTVSAANPGINVNITNFPPTAALFYEGNFSGTFTDNQSVSHTISCNFRVRRVF
jgi:hypothetical protein